ncbi:hypothetical protein BCM26_04200 [Bacillus subtilis]|nr:hypothetical protein BCM26_04200 [Bacillus subtilis]OJH64113.1 hypothetical protein BOH71_07195 [Bacillus subtilis]
MFLEKKRKHTLFLGDHIKKTYGKRMAKGMANVQQIAVFWERGFVRLCLTSHLRWEQKPLMLFLSNALPMPLP